MTLYRRLTDRLGKFYLAQEEGRMQIQEACRGRVNRYLDVKSKLALIKELMLDLRKEGPPKKRKLKIRLPPNDTEGKDHEKKKAESGAKEKEFADGGQKSDNSEQISKFVSQDKKDNEEGKGRKSMNTPATVTHDIQADNTNEREKNKSRDESNRKSKREDDPDKPRKSKEEKDPEKNRKSKDEEIPTTPDPEDRRKKSKEEKKTGKSNEGRPSAPQGEAKPRGTEKKVKKLADAENSEKSKKLQLEPETLGENKAEEKAREKKKRTKHSLESTPM